MIMIDQSKRLSEPLRWTKAGRTAVALMAVIVVVVATLAGIFALTSSSKEAPGCITVTFASTLGAAAQHACGAKARNICAHPAQNPALADKGALRDACRKADLPYG